jgi:thiamine kinase-like enzyme
MLTKSYFSRNTMMAVTKVISPEIIHCEHIPYGADNKVLNVTTSIGQKLVCKIYTKKNLPEVQELVEIGNRLRSLDIPYPESRPVIASNVGPVVVMNFVEGEMLASPEQVSPELWVDLFSRLRLLSPEIVSTRKGLPPRTIPEFLKFVSKYPSLYDHLLNDLREVYKFIPDSLYTQDTFCHGDISLSNVLVSDKKIVAVLDHDHCYAGNIIDDISRALMFIAFPKEGDQLADQKFLDSLLLGYIEQNNLSRFGITPKTIVAWSLVHICFMALNTDYYDYLEQRDPFVKRSYAYSASDHERRFYKLQQYLYNQH